MKFIVALLLVFLSLPAMATIYIHNNPGGNIYDFIDRANHWKRTGQHVVISGYCNSACTMIPYIMGNYACVMPGTTFGYHGAFIPRRGGRKIDDLIGSQMLMEHYSPAVQAFVRRNNAVATWRRFTELRASSRYFNMCR